MVASRSGYKEQNQMPDFFAESFQAAFLPWHKKITPTAGVWHCL
jgi:hypothetical protein